MYPMGIHAGSLPVIDMSEEDYARGQNDAYRAINDARHIENGRRFDKIEATLEELVAIVNVSKGGLRTLYAVGSVSAAIGVFASSAFRYIVEHLK